MHETTSCNRVLFLLMLLDDFQLHPFDAIASVLKAIYMGHYDPRKEQHLPLYMKDTQTQV